MRVLAKHPADLDPTLPWIDESVEVQQDGPVFRRLAARRRSRFSGRIHTFTRLQGPDWVNVIAFTPFSEGAELLVVQQFRHGVDEATFEIPGGSCDAGEDPLQSAQRELLEETGHASSHWVALGHCQPNPATQNNLCHSFLALDCRPQGDLECDAAEELSVWAMSWAEWEGLVAQGDIRHALVLTAFSHLHRWEGWPTLAQRLGQP